MPEECLRKKLQPVQINALSAINVIVKSCKYLIAKKKLYPKFKEDTQGPIVEMFIYFLKFIKQIIDK